MCVVASNYQVPVAKILTPQGCTIQALIIGIGLEGLQYHKCNQEPANSTGNYIGPWIKVLVSFLATSNGRSWASRSSRFHLREPVTLGLQLLKESTKNHTICSPVAQYVDNWSSRLTLENNVTTQPADKAWLENC